MNESLDIIKVRQQRLRLLISERHKSQRQFALRHGLKPQVITRWLSEDYESAENFRPIHRNTCKAIEDFEGLPDKWMDTPLPDQVLEGVIDDDLTASDFRGLDSESKALVRAVIQKLKLAAQQ